jgi:hypothetical protein
MQQIKIIILFIGISLFIFGCMFKSGLEKKEWFRYAAKYDSQRQKLDKSGGLIKYFSNMEKMRHKFLQSEQPSESEIISVLKSKDMRTQKIGLVAMSLKPIQTDQLADILIEFLQDQDFYFKQYACSALDQFAFFSESKKPQLEKQLLQIVKEEIPKGKKGIAFQEFSLLAKVPSQETATFLEEQLIKEGKENRILRLAAFVALKKMGDSYLDRAAEYVKENGNVELQKEFLGNQNYYNDPNNIVPTKF